MLLFRSLDPENLLKYLPKQATIDMCDWTPLNARNPLNQYRDGLGNFMSKSAHRLAQHKSKRYHWMGNGLRSKHLEQFPIRRPDTLKGDKVQVEIICKRCQDPRTAFTHQDPRYSLDGAYLRRVSFCESCDQHREFVPLDASIKSTSHTSIVSKTLRRKAKMGDARAQQVVNSSNAYVSTWRHRWLNEGDEKELRERWNKLRAKDHARYNDRQAKAAKGDEKAQAAIQHYNDLNRSSYHARRQRAAEGDKEARAQLDKELKNKRMRVDRRNRALIESRERSEKCNSASRLETQRLLRSEDLLADILFERARCRRKVKLEIRQPFEDQVNISEMALKSSESLIAIAEVSKEGIDRNVYRQWLLHIRDINLLCLLNLLDLKTWMKGMGGGGWGVNCSIRTLLQEAESVLLAEGVEEAKWSLKNALEVLRQRFPDRRNVKKREKQT